MPANASHENEYGIMNHKMQKKIRFMRYALLIACCVLPVFVSAADYSLDDVDPLGPVTNKEVAGNPIRLVAKLINYIMGFLGAIIFGVFIYGGITILFSGGNSKRVEKGKKTLFYATLGIVAIFFSYAALHLIFTILEKIKE